MKVGILALQGDVREHARAVESAGGTAAIVKRPDELADADALILPGGESTTIGKLLDRFDLLDPLRNRAAAGMPVYGTCAGVILMAKDVVGDQDAPHRVGVMDIAVRRNAYGRQVDSFESDLDVAGLRDPFTAVFIRAPVIERAGPGVEVLASHRGHPVLVRQDGLFGSTFHPELTPDHRLHELFLKSARRN